MMTGTEALPREVGPLRSVTSRRNGAAFMVSKLAADWPREMMAGALANRLPAVPSSPVCRSGTVPALYLNVGRGLRKRELETRGEGDCRRQEVSSATPRRMVQMLRQFRSLVQSGSCVSFLLRRLFFVFVDIVVEEQTGKKQLTIKRRHVLRG